jgi:hypothetical protein
MTSHIVWMAGHYASSSIMDPTMRWFLSIYMFDVLNLYLLASGI